LVKNAKSYEGRLEEERQEKYLEDEWVFTKKDPHYFIKNKMLEHLRSILNVCAYSYEMKSSKIPLDEIQADVLLVLFLEKFDSLENEEKKSNLGLFAKNYIKMLTGDY